MDTIVVTETRNGWIHGIADVEVVDATEYLTDPRWSRRRGLKVYNLPRSFGYQSIGYYVSLLAEARGHRAIPSVMTMQDLDGRSAVRLIPNTLDQLIQKSLESIQSDQFTLSVYFGQNVAKRHERLARELSSLFRAPLLRFQFSRRQKWRLRQAHTIGSNDIPQSHWPFIIEAADRHFARPPAPRAAKRPARYQLAILHNPKEGELAPSDPAALQKFLKAASACGLAAELITKEDAGRLLQFDALFIRETTAVNHYTYRLARRAQHEGLVVIDDPASILRCTNKVFLAELLAKAKLAAPKTVVVYRGNADTLIEKLGLPCVLKRPDSAFSQGVLKAESEQELAAHLNRFFEDSELVVAQQYMRTEFDWRIGVLDRRPFFASKYHMARGHWQIARHQGDAKPRFGKCETVPIELAPRKAVAIAQKAADLIGDGLYGVDVKEADGKFYVIEVNDNPNLDTGVEDKVLREELYLRIMESFVRRIEKLKA